MEMFDYYSNKGIKTFYLPNAIDIEDLPKNSMKKFAKQIVFASRLSKEKGILEVLKMTEKLSDDIHLFILGSGSEEPKVQEITQRKKNVHFLGYQNKEKTEQASTND